MAREEQRFTDAHPKSKALAERTGVAWLAGAPMSWMREAPSPFPVFAERAKGSTLTDVDGHEYADLCMADTGALMGHSPDAVAAAIAERAGTGMTLFTPTEDAAWVGEELVRRFGLPVWQSAITATDANRFCIAFSRQITGRAKVLVFQGCYHGSLAEATVSLDAQGNAVGRTEVYGAAGDPAHSARCVEQNDLAALERELAFGDVACVLTEPCLTNVGIVPPAEGWHEDLRALTRKHGALLNHGRDPHDLRRAGGLHEGMGARTRHVHDRQVGCGRGAGRALRLFGGDRPAGEGSDGALRRLGHERGGQHAGGQRAPDGGAQSDPRACHDRGELRPEHDSGGGSIS